jgi:hypothetical protein
MCFWLPKRFNKAIFFMRRNGKGRIDNANIRFIGSLIRVTTSDRIKNEEGVETYDKLKNITTQAV